MIQSLCAFHVARMAPLKRSHRLMQPSVDPLKRAPARVVSKHVKHDSEPERIRDTKSMFSKFQHNSSPSSAVLSSVLSMSSKHLTGPECFVSVAIFSPLSISQRPIVASSEPLKSTSSCNAKHQIGPVWPQNSDVALPVSKSHRLTVLSTEPEKSSVPEAMRQVTGLLCPCKVLIFLPEFVLKTKMSLPTAAQTTRPHLAHASHNICEPRALAL
mmetsp:Transcript_79219/g.199061  ORF Transcript_79219/g.199061 Transcript_79219/m.199061 type:complete len:214 (-) Transcript_79219:59-700(-)